MDYHKFKWNGKILTYSEMLNKLLETAKRVYEELYNTEKERKYEKDKKEFFELLEVLYEYLWW